jgi:membrane fusion protein (multidrug efflux system)
MAQMKPIRAEAPVSLAPPPAPAQAQAPALTRRRRSIGPLRLAIIGAVVLAAIAYGAYEVYMRITHVSEYDARVAADIVTISSRADGWVIDLPALEGTRVETGQVIVRIDDRVTRLRAEALQAQIQAVQADRNRLLAERRMVENQAAAKTKTRTSGVRASEAARAALEADILLARQELDRSRSLAQRGIITDRQLETAQANVTRLEGTRRKLDAERLQAEGTLGEAMAERDRLEVIDGQIAALDPVEANLQAQLRQQMIDVGDRTIKSPIPAVIDRVFVEPGEYMQAGQRILMLHNPEEVWVEVNIKETQIRKLKLGQPVKVNVDAYPDDKFEGKVARIGSAATSRFALLPTPNPSGNFTKITQRMAVKIDFTKMPKPLSPGMMVEVDIDVR